MGGILQGTVPNHEIFLYQRGTVEQEPPFNLIPVLVESA